MEEDNESLHSKEMDYRNQIESIISISSNGRINNNQSKNLTAPNQSASGSNEDQIFIALRRINQSINLHSKDLMKNHGLTAPQLIVLQEINKSSKISPGHLAKIVSLSQATVSGIVKRLEKQGLVVRQQDKTDRRKVIGKATDDARKVLKTDIPIMQNSFIESFNNLYRWEQNMILSSLQHLATLLNAE